MNRADPHDIAQPGSLDGEIAESLATKPTIVLVPGAFTDDAGWSALAEALRGRGYGVVIAVNPLQGLEPDTASLVEVLKGVDNHIILVGHSYGGMLISNAACASYDVEALVFVAAFAPEKGESLEQLLGEHPDAAPGEVTIAGLADDPAWKVLPSWFVYGDADECITQEMHALFAHRAGAVDTIIVRGGFHDLAMTHPAEIIAAIDMAATSTIASAPNITAD